MLLTDNVDFPFKSQISQMSIRLFCLMVSDVISDDFTMQVKVLKPRLEQQVQEEVSKVMLQRQHSHRSLPKVSLDAADVSFLAQSTMTLTM